MTKIWVHSLYSDHYSHHKNNRKPMAQFILNSSWLMASRPCWRWGKGSGKWPGTIGPAKPTGVASHPTFHYLHSTSVPWLFWRSWPCFEPASKSFSSIAFLETAELHRPEALVTQKRCNRSSISPEQWLSAKFNYEIIIMQFSLYGEAYYTVPNMRAHPYKPAPCKIFQKSMRVVSW